MFSTTLLSSAMPTNQPNNTLLTITNINHHLTTTMETLRPCTPLITNPPGESHPQHLHHRPPTLTMGPITSMLHDQAAKDRSEACLNTHNIMSKDANSNAAVVKRGTAYFQRSIAFVGVIVAILLSTHLFTRMSSGTTGQLFHRQCNLIAWLTSNVVGKVSEITTMHLFTFFLPSLVIGYVMVRTGADCESDGVVAMIARVKYRTRYRHDIAPRIKLAMKHVVIGCAFFAFMALLVILARYCQQPLIAFAIAANATPAALLFLAWLSVADARVCEDTLCPVSSEVFFDASQQCSKPTLSSVEADLRNGSMEYLGKFTRSRVSVPIPYTSYTNRRSFPFFCLASIIVLVAFFAIILHSFVGVGHYTNQSRFRQTLLKYEMNAVGISTLLLSVVNLMTNKRRGRSETNARDPYYIVTTSVKLFGFIFAFIPFLAGCFYSTVSQVLLLAIPLTSLAMCTVAGLYVPNLMNLLLSISLLLIGARIVYWFLLLAYHFYSWMLETNQSIFLVVTLIAIAGVFERNALNDKWMSFSKRRFHI